MISRGLVLSCQFATCKITFLFASIFRSHFGAFIFSLRKLLRWLVLGAQKPLDGILSHSNWCSTGSSLSFSVLCFRRTKKRYEIIKMTRPFTVTTPTGPPTLGHTVIQWRHDWFFSCSSLTQSFNFAAFCQVPFFSNHFTPLATLPYSTLNVFFLCCPCPLNPNTTFVFVY